MTIGGAAPNTLVPKATVSTVAEATIPLQDVISRRFSRCQIMTELGSKTRTPWGPHVRFRREQTFVREGSPLVKLRNSCAYACRR